MKSVFIKLLFIFAAFACLNCGSDTDDDTMMGDPDPNPNPNKITTYDGDVKVIIDGQCLRCHTVPLAEGAPFPMRTYQETINGVNNDLVLRMQSTSMNNVMPPSGRLPQDVIDVILDWEADGFLEN